MKRLFAPIVLAGRHLALFVLGAAVLLASGCGDRGKDLQQLVQASEDPCPKSAAELASLVLNPVSCVATSQCPIGSYCNDELGTCAWQCYANEDCGYLQACSCNGVCLAQGDVAQEEPTCPRDAELLLTLAAKPQPCAEDVDCPFGSACDPATTSCTFACLPGSAVPAHGCPAGEACDCRGTCRSSPAPATAPVAVRPLFDVSPTIYQYYQPYGVMVEQSSTITLEWTAPPGGGAESAPSPILYAQSADGAEVSCDGSGFHPACTFGAGSWTWVAIPERPGVFVATATIQARPVDDPMLGYGPGPWSVRLFSEGTAPQVQTISLQPYEESVNPPLDGYYRGSLYLPAEGAEVRVPVEAWARTVGGSERLLLHDPTRTITPSGKVLVILNGSERRHVLYEQLDATTGQAGKLLGIVREADWATGQPYSRYLGQIQGKFNVLGPFERNESQIPGEQWKYDLRWVRPIRALGDAEGSDLCDAQGACRTGTSCNSPGFIDVCAEGATIRESPQGATSNTLESTFVSDWNDEVVRVLEGMASYPDLFLPANVYSESDGYPALWAGQWSWAHELAGGEVLASSRNLGRALCDRDWLDAASRDPNFSHQEYAIRADIVQGGQQPDTFWSESCQLFFNDEPSYLTLNTQGLHFSCTGNQDCWDGLTCISGQCEYSSCVSHQDCDDGTYCADSQCMLRDVSVTFEQMQKPYVPCVWLADSSTPVSPYDPDGAGFSLSCEKLFAPSSPDVQQRALNGFVWENAGSSWWIDRACYRTDMLWDVVEDPPEGYSYRTYEVHLCPLTDAYLERGRNPKTPLTRYACYRPSENPPGRLLDSTVDEAGWDLTSISGERRCSDGRFSAVAPLLTVRDRFEEGDGEGLPIKASEMLDRCVAELSALPSGAPVTESNAQELWLSYFNESECFSPARFARLLELHLPGEDGLGLANLLRQWLTVHSFVASQALLEEDARTVTEVLGTAPRDIPLESIAWLGLRAWAPIVGSEGIEKVFEATAFDPSDSRGPDQDQDQPVQTLMLETLSMQGRLVSKVLENMASPAFLECQDGRPGRVATRALDLYADYSTLAASAESIARELTRSTGVDVPCEDDSDCSSAGGHCRQEGTCAGSSQVHWYDRWTRALDEVSATRAGLAAQATSIQRCDNPLGIDDRVAPMFFVDPAGASSRYFASSDYLTSTWARPAVASAREALLESRDAWIARRSSEIQERENQVNRRRSLEETRREYGKEIVEICGLRDIEAADAVAELSPGGSLQPTSCHIDPKCAADDTNPDCMRGVLGGAVLDAAVAAADVEVATAEMDGLIERWWTRSQLCSEIHKKLTGLDQLILFQDAQIAGLRAAGAAAMRNARTAHVLRNPRRVNEFADGVMSLFGASINDDIDRVRNEMEETIARHERRVTEILNKIEVERCLAEADALFAGIAAASERVESQSATMEMAGLRVAGLFGQLRRIRDEGRAAIDREEARTLPSISHHHWFDEKVARFKSELAWARRLTFLAVTAAEVELQQSFGWRGQALAAVHPDELDEVLLSMEQALASRTINGRRPEPTSIVLSLRDDVLATSDEAALASSLEGTDGEQAGHRQRSWSAWRRFRERIGAPRFAWFDDAGRYLGQAVPFTMRPLNALDGICGERIGRVTASIQGSVPGDSVPAASLVLLKSNTASSRFCAGKGDGQEMQLISTGGSADLFRPSATGGREAWRQPYVASLLSPWFNVPRSELSSESFLEGGSEELAGRPLFGGYVLLFPYYGLLDQEEGLGMPLSSIEDVLIRFDLLAVPEPR